MSYRYKTDPDADPCGHELDTRELPLSLKVWNRAWSCAGEVHTKYLDHVKPAADKIIVLMFPDGRQPKMQPCMIGRDRQTATPFLLIFSPDKALREKAVRALVKSDVRKLYPEWSFVHCKVLLNQPKGYHDTRLAGYADDDDEDTDTDEEEDEFFEIQSALPLRLGGRLWSIKKDRPFRSATAGPMLVFGDRRFLITTGHIVEPEETEMVPEDDDGEDYFFDDPYLAQYNSRAGGVGRGSTDSWRVSTAVDTTSRSSNIQVAPVGDAVAPRYGDDAAQMRSIGAIDYDNTIHSRAGSRPNLDYVLVEVQARDVPGEYNQVYLRRTGASVDVRGIAPPPRNRDVRVVVCAASSPWPMHGTLRACPPTTFYLWSPSGSQDMYAVVLDSDVLQVGDSGAAVIDEATGHFLGVIARGCAGAGLGYMVSSTELFHDIRQQAECELPLMAVDTLRRRGPRNQVWQDDGVDDIPRLTVGPGEGARAARRSALPGPWVRDEIVAEPISGWRSATAAPPPLAAQRSALPRPPPGRRRRLRRTRSRREMPPPPPPPSLAPGLAELSRHAVPFSSRPSGPSMAGIDLDDAMESDPNQSDVERRYGRPPPFAPSGGGSSYFGGNSYQTDRSGPWNPFERKDSRR